tara:strand:+ start:4973 stop:5158 length:186 start_codon:yes stop_codon:yes gene_type:complete
MKEEKIFQHNFDFEFLPASPLIGISIQQGEIKCYDKEFRPMIHVQLGFLFFKISYTNVTYN